ncbi:AMP-binding protein, partial [Viridibacillus arvi]
MKQTVDVSPDQTSNQKDYWLDLVNKEYEKVSLIAIEGKNIANRDYKNYMLDEESVAKLTKIAKNDDLMVYIILLTVTQITISKYSGVSNFLLGIPQYLVSKEMINNNEFLLMPTSMSDEVTFKELLLENRKRIFNLYNNQSYPIIELVKRMEIYDKINVFFTMENIHSEKQIEDILKQENNDLTFKLKRIDEEIHLSFCYFDNINSDLIINLYMNILKEILNNLYIKVKDIEVVEKKEIHKLLVEFNETNETYSKNKTIHQLFEEQVQKTPNNVAVRIDNKEITYKELNERANALAKTLIEKGVKPDSRIGIMLEPSIEMIVGNIAILKAGGAYVPIDPSYPNSRINYIIEDCSINIILTCKELKSSMVFNGETLDIFDETIYSDCFENIEHLSFSNNLAYIVYTSGSSGIPKGVMIEHGGISATIQWRKVEYNFSEDDIALPIVSNTFDGFVTSFYTPLVSGSKVILLSNIQKEDITLIKECIVEEKITHLIAVPSLSLAIMDNLDPTDQLNIKVLTVAGEMLTPNIVVKCKNIRPNMEIVNEYGPTENSVISTIKRGINTVDKITIGNPISNTKIYILDQSGKIVPIGVAGEICISGDGLARGYLN